jgi:hypothetical protein
MAATGSPYIQLASNCHSLALTVSASIHNVITTEEKAIPRLWLSKLISVTMTTYATKKPPLLADITKQQSQESD